MDHIRLFVGVDPREIVGFHVFVQSVLSRTDRNRISIHPVMGEQRDGSNSFIYQRFLIPWMCGFKGRAIWADGDMICRVDIRELWDLFESGYDVMCVKHSYSTKWPIKYLGQRNEDYERKNWSSLMLLECGNYPWRKITPEYVKQATGKHLHRFEFLKDERVGDLPNEWNWLALEQEYNPSAKLVHHTVGLPCWEPYATMDPYAGEWRDELRAVNYFQSWEPNKPISQEAKDITEGVLGVSGR